MLETNNKILNLLWKLLIVISLGTSQSVFADNQTQKSSSMLIVKSVVGLPETGYAITTTAEIGYPNITEDKTYTLTGETHSIIRPEGVGVEMHYEYDPNNLPPGGGVIGWAGPYFESRASTLAAAISTYAKANGLSGGLYSYEQKLRVKGNPIPVILTWQIISYADGRYVAKYAKIIPIEPCYAQVEYIPDAITNGLDSGLKYTNAGLLTYRLLDRNLQPLTSDVVVDTSGAFDVPYYSGTGTIPVGCVTDEEGDVICDQDYGIKCLVNKNSSAECPTGFKDVLTLIEDWGALGGILDYTRKLSPVYDEYEDPPGSGEMVQIPRVSISIDSRVINDGKTFFFIAQGGGSTYTETGTYGITLLHQTDRYLVFSDGRYELTEQNTSTEASPSYPFVKVTTVPNRCESYRPDYIIDPFDTLQIYEWTNDTVNGLPADRYTSVAGLICTN